MSRQHGCRPLCTGHETKTSTDRSIQEFDQLRTTYLIELEHIRNKYYDAMQAALNKIRQSIEDNS